MREREYSTHSGLSRGAIQKAKQTGRMVLYRDGSVDAAASDARRAEMTDPDQQRRSVGGDSNLSSPADSTSYLYALRFDPKGGLRTAAALRTNAYREDKAIRGAGDPGGPSG